MLVYRRVYSIYYISSQVEGLDFLKLPGLQVWQLAKFRNQKPALLQEKFGQ